MRLFTRKTPATLGRLGSIRAHASCPRAALYEFAAEVAQCAGHLRCHAPGRKLSSRLSALAVSVETYHQQIEAAKDSQKLLLGTIDDIVKGRLTTFSRERYSDQQSIYVEHMIESGTQPPFCRSREDQGPVSSCESLRDLERISVLHQRALKASQDLQAVEVLTRGQLKLHS